MVTRLFGVLLLVSCSTNISIDIGSCYKYDNSIWIVTSKRGLTLVYLRSEQGEIALDAQVVKYFPVAECPSSLSEGSANPVPVTGVNIR